MTWERRIALTKLWLYLHALPVGLAIVGFVFGVFCLLVYLPARTMTSHEGTIAELEFHDDEQLGRQPRFLVNLDQGKLVRVSGRRGDGCRKGDRIAVVHLGGFRGYTSGVAGCRRPVLPEQNRPG